MIRRCLPAHLECFDTLYSVISLTRMIHCSDYFGPQADSSHHIRRTTAIGGDLNETVPSHFQHDPCHEFEIETKERDSETQSKQTQAILMKRSLYI